MRGKQDFAAEPFRVAADGTETRFDSILELLHLVQDYFEIQTNVWKREKTK